MWGHRGAIGAAGSREICFGKSYSCNGLGFSCAGKRFCLKEASPLEEPVIKFVHELWSDDQGQDIAEYAVMLAVILVIVVGTIRLIGSNANTVFSQVGSAIQ
jgi:pilus assembly protein Flp/PilA